MSIEINLIGKQFLHIYAEMKHSDWMQVTWLVLTNHSTDMSEVYGYYCNQTLKYKAAQKLPKK